MQALIISARSLARPALALQTKPHDRCPFPSLTVSRAPFFTDSQGAYSSSHQRADANREESCPHTAHTTSAGRYRAPVAPSHRSVGPSPSLSRARHGWFSGVLQPPTGPSYKRRRTPGRTRTRCHRHCRRPVTHYTSCSIFGDEDATHHAAPETSAFCCFTRAPVYRFEPRVEDS